MLDDNLRPKQVNMLVSNAMLERSQALEKILKVRGISVEKTMIEDPWDATSISGKVEDILKAYSQDGIALNATCGTKLMSIAAYEVFRTQERPIYYIHPHLDRLLWLYPKLPSVEIADRLKLNDYLTAYGAKDVNIPPAASVPPPIRGLSEHIITHINNYLNALATLNYLAQEADNQNFQASIKKEQNSQELISLVSEFSKAGICASDGKTIRFANENARFLANGGWLEQYTYHLCQKIKKPGLIQDLALNVTISRKSAGKEIIKNEIDIALIKNNHLHLIECKTKRYKMENDADVLYKLDSLCDLMGGLQGRAMLVSFNPLNEASRARAKELKIQLCCHTQLSNLESHIKNWLHHER